MIRTWYSPKVFSINVVIIFCQLSRISRHTESTVCYNYDLDQNKWF